MINLHFQVVGNARRPFCLDTNDLSFASFTYFIRVWLFAAKMNSEVQSVPKPDIEPGKSNSCHQTHGSRSEQALPRSDGPVTSNTQDEFPYFNANFEGEQAGSGRAFNLLF